MVWRILEYMKHLFYRWHRKGRHIHSPYLFAFVHDVVFNAPKTLIPLKIREVHQSLRSDRTLIPLNSGGARSAMGKSENRTIRSFVRGSSVTEKYGALLHRITHWFHPEMIIELGTGLGISSIYLAAGSPDTPMHTIEGNSHRVEFATGLIKRCELNGVKVHRGDLDKKLMELITDIDGRFVAFVDGNHHYDPTVKYVESLVAKAGDEAVIIMDDIYWSRGMYRAWKEVISWPEVKVSIDLYHMGILLLRQDLYKANVKIKF